MSAERGDGDGMRERLIVATLVLAVVLAIVAVVLVRLYSPAEPPVRPMAAAPEAPVYRPSAPPVGAPLPAMAPEPAREPAPLPEESTPVVAATPEAPADDFADLQWIHSKYIYESFTQLGRLRVGRMFNHESRQSSTVNEGEELEPGSGVVVESLDGERAIVRLRDATDVMICTGNPKYAFLAEWQKHPRPPTDEERRLAHEHYMAQHGLRANVLAARAGRPPAPPWREPTEEEMRDAMLNYLATTGQEAEKRQNEGYVWRQPDPRLLTPEKIAENRRAFYRAIGAPEDTEPIYRDEERWEPRIPKLGLEEEQRRLQESP